MIWEWLCHIFPEGNMLSKTYYDVKKHHSWFRSLLWIIAFFFKKEKKKIVCYIVVRVVYVCIKIENRSKRWKFYKNPTSNYYDIIQGFKLTSEVICFVIGWMIGSDWKNFYSSFTNGGKKDIIFLKNIFLFFS